MSKEIEIRQECCNIWNGLKDKTKMIDYLIESKRTIADLETKLAESEKDLEIVCVEGKDTIREYAEITNSQQEKIFKLKQQLAEKDQAIENWKTMYESVMQTCNNDAKEIDRLRERLVEKEDLLKTHIQLNEDLIKRLDDRCDICIKRHKHSQNQTAIEKLEEVKEWLNIPFDENCCLKNGEDLENYINQQIKELKGDADD